MLGTKKPGSVSPAVRTKSPAPRTIKPTVGPTVSPVQTCDLQENLDYGEAGKPNSPVYRFQGGQLRPYTYKKTWGNPRGSNPWNPTGYDAKPISAQQIAACTVGPAMPGTACDDIRDRLAPGEIMFCTPAETTSDPSYRWNGAIIRDKQDGKLYNLGNVWYFLGQPRQGKTPHQLRLPTCYPWVLNQCAQEAKVCKYLDEGATYLISDPAQGYKGAFRWENGKYRMYATQQDWINAGKPVKAWGPLSLLVRQGCPRGPDITAADTPQPVTTSPSPYTMQPMSVSTDVEVGNNDLQLGISNSSNSTNNIANTGGGGGGGDDNTALLLAALLGQQQQQGQTTYPYPNPFPAPYTGYNPFSPTPSVTPSPGPTAEPDPTAALLQQLAMTPLPTQPPTPWYLETKFLIGAGIVLLVVLGVGVWWFFGRKGKKGSNSNANSARNAGSNSNASRGAANNFSASPDFPPNFSPNAVSPVPNLGARASNRSTTPAF